MFQTYINALKIFVSTPTFKKKAVEIALVTTAAFVGAIVANKFDPAETIEVVAETTKAA